MATVTLQDLQKEAVRKKLPQFKAGQTVKVHQKIQEGNKERVQIFQGLIIEVSGSGVARSITVRRIVDGFGVEKVFPVHAPSIVKIELIKEAKVRRSRIFFMRERSGKSARLQERFFSEAELAEMVPHEVTEEEVEEAVQHEEEQKEPGEASPAEPEVKKEEKAEEKEEKEEVEKLEDIKEEKPQEGEKKEVSTEEKKEEEKGTE